MINITGAELTALRKRLGFSQRDLAERLSLNYNTVWRWESDINTGLQPLAYWALVGMLARSKHQTSSDQ